MQATLGRMVYLLPFMSEHGKTLSLKHDFKHLNILKKKAALFEYVINFAANPCY